MEARRTEVRYALRDLGRGRDSRVALVSDALARRRFGSGRAAFGGKLLLDQAPHTIVTARPRFRA